MRTGRRWTPEPMTVREAQQILDKWDDDALLFTLDKRRRQIALTCLVVDGPPRKKEAQLTLIFR